VIRKDGGQPYLRHAKQGEEEEKKGDALHGLLPD
jgi:hypothetical protein